MIGKIAKIAKWLSFFVFLFGLLGGGFYLLQAQTDVFFVTASIGRNKMIVPNEKIVINFSHAVSPESYEGKIRITPENSFDIKWENNSRSLLIMPKNFWQVGTAYEIEIGEGRSRFLTNIKKQYFNFSTVGYPSISEVIPKNDAKDVVVDIEDPIIVRFDRSFENFYIRFNFYPATEIDYKINSDKTEFQILPKIPLKDGEKYKIDIFAKYINDTDETYKPIFSSSFETRLPAPITWEKDLGLRVEQAKKFTKPQILTGKYIDINLSTQIMTIFEEGALLDSYLVSSGKRGMETSKGKFKIENKALKPWSKEYGLFMPNWMALVPSGKFGIHELPEWPGGYKEGKNHLGIPVSHGCVRLGVGPSKRVFDWAEIGTPVIIY